MTTSGRLQQERFPWLFFIFVLGISWLIWSPGTLATIGLVALPVPSVVFFFVGTWGPFLAAVFVTYLEAGREGVTRFLRRGLDWRFSGFWWLVVLVVPLAVAAVPLGLHVLLGGLPPESSLLSQPWMILPVFATYFLTGGGNEERGWRGYALDRLQSRWSPLIASVVLGLIWGLWHLPLFFIEGTGQWHMSFIAFLVASPALSILHTWVYNGTGGKLVAVWLLHSLLGTVWEFFPIVQPGLTGYWSVHIYDVAAVILLAAAVVVVIGSDLLIHDNGQLSDRGSALPGASVDAGSP